MIATDQDALVCDLAETYGIYDLQALPVLKLATLAAGLRENSRIRIKMSGLKVNQESLLLAMAVDSLQFLAWTKTKAAQEGKNRPKSVARILLGQPEEKPLNVAYECGEDFDEAWRRMAGGES